MIKLTNQDIHDIALARGYEYAELKAFIQVESTGSGFDKLGNLMIQFEPHVFAKWLDIFDVEHTLSKSVRDGRTSYKIIACIKGTTEPIELTNGIEVQTKELAAYDIALKIDERAAKLSTSWGLPQILGQSYDLAGYTSAQAMIDDFRENEYNQILAMCTFIEKKGIKKYLQNCDWANVARLYNGAGYIKVTDPKKRYDNRLKEEYEKALKEQPE